MKTKWVLLVPILAVVLACGGDSSTAPTTTPAPAATTSVPAAPPPPADAQLQFTGTYECIDRWCDWADFQLSLRNTGGVGANINYLRTKNRDGLTVHEIGADHFVNTFGSNRIEAGGTLDFWLRAQLTYELVIGYGGDNGVGGEVSWFPDLPR